MTGERMFSIFIILGKLKGKCCSRDCLKCLKPYDVLTNKQHQASSYQNGILEFYSKLNQGLTYHAHNIPLTPCNYINPSLIKAITSFANQQQGNSLFRQTNCIIT